MTERALKRVAAITQGSPLDMNTMIGAQASGRENHKMMLDHYQQIKNLLVSYSENKLGFF